MRHASPNSSAKIFPASDFDRCLTKKYCIVYRAEAAFLVRQNVNLPVYGFNFQYNKTKVSFTKKVATGHATAKNCWFRHYHFVYCTFVYSIQTAWPLHFSHFFLVTEALSLSRAQLHLTRLSSF